MFILLDFEQTSLNSIGKLNWDMFDSEAEKSGLQNFINEDLLPAQTQLIRANSRLLEANDEISHLKQSERMVRVEVSF